MTNFIAKARATIQISPWNRGEIGIKLETKHVIFQNLAA